MKRPPVCDSGEHTSPVQCSYPSFCLNSIRGNNCRDPDCGKLHNRNYVDSSKVSTSRRTRKLKETISLLEKVHDLKERISLCTEKPRAKRSKKREKGGRKTVFYRELGHSHSHGAFLGTDGTAVLYPPYLMKSTQRPPPHIRQALLSSSFYAMKYEAQKTWLTCPTSHSFTPSSLGPKSTALTTVLSLTAYMGAWREGTQELIFIKQLQTRYLVEFSLQPHEVGLISFYWGSSANGLWDKADCVPSCCSRLKGASVCIGFSEWITPRICWGSDTSSLGAVQFRTGSDVSRVTRPGFKTKDSHIRAPFHCTASLGKACCPSASKVARHLLPRIRAPLCAGRAVSEARALPRRSLLQRQRLRELTPGRVRGPSAKLLMVAAVQCDFRGWGNTHTISKWPLPPLAHLSPGNSPGFGPVEIYVVAIVY